MLNCHAVQGGDKCVHGLEAARFRSCGLYFVFIKQKEIIFSVKLMNLCCSLILRLFIINRYREKAKKDIAAVGSHAVKLLQSLGKVITSVWPFWQDRNIFTLMFCKEISHRRQIQKEKAQLPHAIQKV